MTPNPEQVLKLAADIVAAKKALDELQAQWEAIFKAATKATGPARSIRDGSFSSRVEGVILGTPGQRFSIAEVAAVLGTDDTLKVGRTLFRLSNTKRIANPKRGMYCTKPRLEAAA